MNIFDYSNLTFKELVTKIGKSRFWDLPKMLEETFKKLPISQTYYVETINRLTLNEINSLYPNALLGTNVYNFYTSNNTYSIYLKVDGDKWASQGFNRVT